MRNEQAEISSLLRASGGVERNEAIQVRDEVNILCWFDLSRRLYQENKADPLIPLIDVMVRDPRLNSLYPYTSMDRLGLKWAGNGSQPSLDFPMIRLLKRNIYQVLRSAISSYRCL